MKFFVSDSFCVKEVYNVTTNRKLGWIRTVITGVSVIKRLSLYEFSLWGRDFVSVVRIIEGHIVEVIFTKNVWAISRDQVFPLFFPGPFCRCAFTLPAGARKREPGARNWPGTESRGAAMLRVMHSAQRACSKTERPLARWVLAPFSPKTWS